MVTAYCEICGKQLRVDGDEVALCVCGGPGPPSRRELRLDDFDADELGIDPNDDE